MPFNPVVQAWEDPSQLDWTVERLLSRQEIRDQLSQSVKWTGVETMRLWKSMKATGEHSRCGGNILEPFLHDKNRDTLAPTKDPFIGQGKHEFKISCGNLYLPSHLTASAESREIHERNEACKKCQKAPNVRYPKCITAKDVDGKMVLNGACAACAYGSHWQQCSFVETAKSQQEGISTRTSSESTASLPSGERDRTQPCTTCGFGLDDTFFCACP